jgi:hypothetical protein
MGVQLADRKPKCNWQTPRGDAGIGRLNPRRHCPVPASGSVAGVAAAEVRLEKNTDKALTFFPHGRKKFNMTPAVS